MPVSAVDFKAFHESVERLADLSVHELVETLQRQFRYATATSGTRDYMAKKRAWYGYVTRELAPAIARKYGLGAGEVSAALWEDIYRHDTGESLEALLPEVSDADYFGDAAANVVEGRLVANGDESARTALEGFMRSAVMGYARQAQIYNTRRVYRQRRRGWREAGYMRVPTGDSTCAWCIMLASRGPVYYTEESAGGDQYHKGELDHFHPFCDCEIVSGFSGDAMLDGYDWHEYEDMYKAAIAKMPSPYTGEQIVDLSGTLANMRRMYGFH